MDVNCFQSLIQTLGKSSGTVSRRTTTPSNENEMEEPMNWSEVPPSDSSGLQLHNNLLDYHWPLPLPMISIMTQATHLVSEEKIVRSDMIRRLDDGTITTCPKSIEELPSPYLLKGKRNSFSVCQRGHNAYPKNINELPSPRRLLKRKSSAALHERHTTPSTVLQHIQNLRSKRAKFELENKEKLTEDTLAETPIVRVLPKQVVPKQKQPKSLRVTFRNESQLTEWTTGSENNVLISQQFGKLHDHKQNNKMVAFPPTPIFTATEE